MEAVRGVGNVIIESTQEILLRASFGKIQGVLATEDCGGDPGSSALCGDFTARLGGAARPMATFPQAPFHCSGGM